MVTLSKATLDALKCRFSTLITQAVSYNSFDDTGPNKQVFGIDTNAWITKLWDEILSHYSEPHRYYHRLTHIYSMLQNLDRYTQYIDNITAVELAIWYHDIIYDPTQTDNERQSADYFRQSLQSSLSNTLVEQVDALIMMTAKHQIEPYLAHSKNRVDLIEQDAKYFLDIDLAILGTDWAIYQAYCQQVRLEYAHVSNRNFKEGRKAVLERFLSRERLYFTNDFYHQYEQAARRHIKQEIKLLAG